MSSKLHMRSVMMVVLLGLSFSSGTSWVSAEEQKKEGTGEVQERAVPRQPPGVFVGSCQCYDGSGTCVEKPKGTCQKGPFQGCSGTCKMTKPSSSGGGMTIK